LVNSQKLITYSSLGLFGNFMYAVNQRGWQNINTLIYRAQYLITWQRDLNVSHIYQVHIVTLALLQLIYAKRHAK